jgi:hypothetical protein
MNIQDAQKIMGEKHFFGPWLAQEYFAVSVPSGRMAVLELMRTSSGQPLTEEILIQHKDTHLLIAIPHLSFEELYRRSFPHHLFENQEWHREMTFAEIVTPWGWHLIRKDVTAESVLKTWIDQQDCVPEGERVQKLHILAYVMATYFLHTKEILYPDHLVRCDDYDPSEKIIVVEHTAKGISLYRNGGETADSRIAIVTGLAQ